MSANKPSTKQNQQRRISISKPYCSLGAGCLTSFLWKSGDQGSGWRYRFNLFRLAAKGGRVSQLFRPVDLMQFVKLVQVMASVIADDGCLSPLERGVLRRLAIGLDEVLTRAGEPAKAGSEWSGTGAAEENGSTSINKESSHGNWTDS